MGICEDLAWAAASDREKELAHKLFSDFSRAAQGVIQDPKMDLAAQAFSDVLKDIARNNFCSLSDFSPNELPQAMEKLLRDHAEEFGKKFSERGFHLEDFTNEQLQELQSGVAAGLMEVQTKVVNESIAP